MDLIDSGASSAERPLSEHLDGAGNEPGFKQELAARGNTEAHVNLPVKRVRNVLDACNFTFRRDMVKPGAATLVAVYLGNRRAKGEITGTSFNYYVRDVRSFCKWMARTGRAPAVALDSLAKIKNADIDSHPRRAITVDEMLRLTELAAKSEPHTGLTGSERAILYRVCFESGLRPGQVRALKVSDFDLKSNPPIVTTHARYVKRRREHTQALRPSLAGELEKLFKDQRPDAPALKLPSKYHMADMLRRDLSAAREEWINAARSDEDREERMRSDFLAEKNHKGEVAVFYSVRHGHGTALANAGVPEKDISASMHHGSRATTARYLHADRASVSRAIGAMPDISYPREPDAAGESKVASIRNDLRGTCATTCIPVDSDDENDPLRQDGASAGACDVCAEVTGESELTGRGGTADATDLKSVEGNLVRVRFPPPGIG